MQSEILSQISAIFSGKGLRRFEAAITTVDSSEIPGKKGLFSEKFKNRFLSKSEDVDENEVKDDKENGKGKTRGINLTRIANMDFKLNFKGTKPDTPPPVPCRHFGSDNSEDLPPPIPERKFSLDSGIDEEFQQRFVFRPLSTVPLPEPYGNCTKSYPSKMYNQGFQRPAHHPPPPPLPTDLSPSPTEEKTLRLPTKPLPHQLKHAAIPAFTPLAISLANGTTPHKDNSISVANGTTSHNDNSISVANGTTPHNDNSISVANGTTSHKDNSISVANGTTSHNDNSISVANGTTPHKDNSISVANGTTPHKDNSISVANGTTSHKDNSISVANGTTPHKDNSQQSLYNDIPDDGLDLPPPPTRRLPPPPPSKLKPTSTVPATISSSNPPPPLKSPKLKGLSHLKLQVFPAADTDLNFNSLPSTTPFTPPPPPPPPPMTPSASKPTIKHTPANGLPKKNILNASSGTLPQTPPAVKELKSYKQLPQLPDKPSQISTLPSGPSLGVRKHLPKPPTSNGSSRIETKLTPSSNQKHPLLHRPVSPLPSPQSSTLSVSVSPMPDFNSRPKHPNKSRPLPTIPSVLTGKKGTPSKVSGGWGGGEVFDPREEDGDIYDLMDSTDM